MDPSSLLYKESGLGAIHLVEKEKIVTGDYVHCNGKEILKSQYPELANVIQKTPKLMSALPGFVWGMKTKNN